MSDTYGVCAPSWMTELTILHVAPKRHRLPTTDFFTEHFSASCEVCQAEQQKRTHC